MASFQSAPSAQPAGPSWSPLVLGGFLANGGAGFAVGGGVRGTNLMGNENYGFQIDGLWSNANYCSACDAGLAEFDFSGRQLSFSGSFLYLFSETSGGWRPHVGGGIVFMRWSISASTDIVFPIEVSTTGTTGGVQVQGGISKDNLTLEARVQTVAGGGVAALVGYRFGGK